MTEQRPCALFGANLEGNTALDGNVADWFERQAQRTPDAIAIVGESIWRYGELHTRMLAFARGLSTYNLNPEATIAVFVDRDGDMIALLLAILRCGYAYVPIDPDDPVDRARRLLAAASCKLVVADDARLALLQSTEAAGPLPPMVRTGDLIDLGADGPAPICARGNDGLAYILFTSGSTGEPKGVEVEHCQLLHILQAARDMFGFGQGDRYLAIATIAFDISVIELFLPLIAGGSLLLRSRAALRDPKAFLEDLRMHDVSVAQLGPSSWSVLLQSGIAMPPLRVAITTGEAVAPDLSRRLAGIAETVWNLYGPTETTVWVTGQQLTALPEAGAQEQSAFSAPIGRPLPRCTALIVDQDDRPVPDGDVGELLIGGAGLARGYRGKPALTAEKYVTLAGNGERYYRTGDLVSRGDDQVIHYHGRIDDQLKIRGVRVEPREVETALLGLREVAGAAATWFATPTGARGLCCAIVLRPGHSVEIADLQKRLARVIPAAMVPSRFVVMQELPLTPNGKVDRKAIRDAVSDVQQGERPDFSHALNLTGTEGRLMEIWAKVLGVETVTLDTHFFAEGGDSLSAIAMMLDVEKAMGAKLDPDDIAKAPRLHDFAKLVETARDQPVDLTNRRAVFPLVDAGTGPPLFFSNVDRNVGQSIPWKVACPLYAIVQWSYGRGFVKAGSIQELATAQIREIQEIQPNGPFRIGGYSLGGLIALEIASQLRKMGEEVEMLFLLDPMAPVRFQTSSTEQVVKSPGYIRPPFSQRLLRQIRKLSVNPFAELPIIKRKIMREINQLGIWQFVTYVRMDLYGRYPTRLMRFLVPRNRRPAFWFTARKFAKSYIAKPYDGHSVAIFHEQGQRYDIWQSILRKDAEFSMVDSTHLGLFREPSINDWMEVLDEAVTRPDKPGK